MAGKVLLLRFELAHRRRDGEHLTLVERLQERFVLSLIQSGSTIVGVYPMNEATAAAYREWRAREGGSE